MWIFILATGLLSLVGSVVLPYIIKMSPLPLFLAGLVIIYFAFQERSVNKMRKKT